MLAGFMPPIEQVAGTIDLAGGSLRVQVSRARLGGGELAASAVLDTAATPPKLALEGTLSGASITGPLFDAPVDLTPTASGAGCKADARIQLTAQGNSPAALLATLDGRLQGMVADGALPDSTLAA